MAGIIPLGTSMNKEDPHTVELGCWDGFKDVSQCVEAFWSKEATSNFEVPLWYSDFLIDIGFGKDVDSKVREFWRNQIKNNYVGDEGRKRIHMASINLRDRDSLHARIADLTTPVLWIHGTSDVVYSVANAKEEIPLFKSTQAKLQVIENGQHFLSFSHPEEIAQALLGFVKEK
jgi:pimeloyl-ACP methyl ester carboxylesterase